MTGTLARGMRILELLSEKEHGLSLGEIADSCSLPKPTAFRVLNDLRALGYVRQVDEHGNYLLSMRIVSLGQRHLSNSRLVELAKPLLRQLADATGELARLSLVEDDELIWVARSYTRRASALRIDSDDGKSARLTCSSSGTAWLMSLPKEDAYARIVNEGFEGIEMFGPNAPRDLDEYLGRLEEARDRGYAMVIDTYEAGVAGAAAPVLTHPEEPAVAVLSLSGPSARLTAAEFDTHAPLLLQLADELGALFAGKAMS